MSLATRLTGRATARFKLVPCDPRLHLIYKEDSARQNTTLTEVIFLDLCRARGLDPITLQPIASEDLVVN